MQAIAAEHNLSETAFFVPSGDSGGSFGLRWFTPLAEVDLCGHATLATAHVLFDEIGVAESAVSFETKSGVLAVESGEWLRMRLPAVVANKVDPPDGLLEALGVLYGEVFVAAGDFVVTLNSPDEVGALTPDSSRLSEIDCRAVCVTAPGRDGVDYVSRVFAPRVGIDEDPATGSAHCALTPFWGAKLGVDELKAVQLSPRRGEFRCEWAADRDHVFVKGRCRTYLRGSIAVDEIG